MKSRAIRNKPIRQPDSRGIPEGGKLILFLLGLSLPFLAFVHISATKIKGEYRITHLVDERNDLRQEHQKLLLKKEALLSSSNTMKIATEKLGMVDEGPAVVIDSQGWHGREVGKGVSR